MREAAQRRGAKCINAQIHGAVEVLWIRRSLLLQVHTHDAAAGAVEQNEGTRRRRQVTTRFVAV